MNIKSMIFAMVPVLLALVAYDLVVKGLIMRTDTYEYDEFEGGYAPMKVDKSVAA